MRMNSADGIPQGTPPTGLDGLLMHPAIWRGRSLAPIDTHATGCARLDEALPGRGWPATGLTEILTRRPGLGELRLLVPWLVALGLGYAVWQLSHREVRVVRSNIQLVEGTKLAGLPVAVWCALLAFGVAGFCTGSLSAQMSK